ncbi:MAG: SH3 domain-containing protein [Aggregatilineales bacterium]
MTDQSSLPPIREPEREPTQPVEAQSAPRPLPPPPGGHVQPAAGAGHGKKGKRGAGAPAQSVERRKSARARDTYYRSRSGLYLPAWSILLMLATVFIVAFGIVALVIALGGGSPPAGSPRIIIVTALPSATLEDGVSQQNQNAPLIQGLPEQGAAGAVPVFPLEGPTLPPVVFTPTPISILVGSTVTVNAPDGLNIRARAGLDGQLLFNASNGTLFRVVGGPELANGLTWWQVEDPANPARGGWAAGDYLNVQTP